LNTQQNAAMAEETNAAAQGLSQQASRLAQLVSRFRLERRSEPRDPNEDLKRAGGKDGDTGKAKGASAGRTALAA
ncbi:MAG: hypothetical protein RIS94_3667, partial [Pseudomonadota bacterium]